MAGTDEYVPDGGGGLGGGPGRGGPEVGGPVAASNEKIAIQCKIIYQKG